MMDSFLFIALPYIAAVVCVLGSIIRIKKWPTSYSALSSQFLEPKALMWGSVPWHIGIVVITIGHLLAFCAPGAWQALMSKSEILLATETVGFAAGVICLAGLIVLILRRIGSSKVQAVTSTMDLIVLGLLLAQVLIGLAVAVHYRYGAAWVSGTASPYLWSLFTLQPNLQFIQDLPLAVKAHMVLAYLLILLIPFSRLIHMFAVPLQYLFRPPQNVVWNSPRHAEASTASYQTEEARREFIKGAAGITLGCGVLAVGTVDKVYNFFFGPRLTAKEEEEIMATRLKRLQMTANQRKLELERQTSNFILVAALSDLKANEGKYFIDFNMNTAMAFSGDNGLPILMSAKCTHLGCTVSNQVDDKGQVLCPCHVSFFDVKTGKPNAGAPAKNPLPMLPWAIMDKKGKVVAERGVSGQVTGDTSLAAIKECNVYITRDLEAKST